jgi:hypothetical protein
MLAYPSSNASHGRLGNAQRETGRKESVGVSWSVGEMDRVLSGSGEGGTGLVGPTLGPNEY